MTQIGRVLVWEKLVGEQGFCWFALVVCRSVCTKQKTINTQTPLPKELIIRPSKNLCVFRVTSKKQISRVGRKFFFLHFFYVGLYYNYLTTRYIWTKHHNSHKILPSLFVCPLMNLKVSIEWQTV